MPSAMPPGGSGDVEVRITRTPFDVLPPARRSAWERTLRRLMTLAAEESADEAAGPRTGDEGAAADEPA